MGFNVDDLKKSSFITQKDVDPPVLVTITGSKKANMAQEGAKPDYQWTLLFKEIDKPFVVNATNGQLIEAITGSKNSDDWTGCKIVLYIDPTVMFRGEITGGVRCRAPRNQPIQDTPAEDAAAQAVVDDVAEKPRDDIPF